MRQISCVLILVAMAAAVSPFEPMSITSHFNPFLEFLNQEEITPRAVVQDFVTQRVDNFDNQNQDTFQQRFYMNGEFFQRNGPLIILIGGFTSINQGRIARSMPLNVARELHGYVFYLEHRYYGRSFPTPDLSDTNLRYLTPDQALADIAHFINHIKQPNVIPGAQDSPVIVVGSSYGGNLAVWFRQKYPHLALGAWASSAPVLSIVNYQLYKETAAETYRSIGGDECYNQLETSFTYLEQQVQAGNLQQISNIFHLCPNSTLATERGISFFFLALSEFFSIIPQFATVHSILGTCNLITEPAETPAHNILRALDFVGDNTNSTWCLALNYTTLIELERETALDAPVAVSGVRQLTYMLCTQIGWMHTSDSPNQPFGNRFPLDFTLQWCEDVFGAVFSNSSLHSASDRINTVHGGLNPRVTNVVFTHGSLDPWRTIGVLEPLNDESPVLITPGAHQAQDLDDFDERDSEELSNTRVTVKNLIRSWIARDQGIIVDSL